MKDLRTIAFVLLVAALGFSCEEEIVEPVGPQTLEIEPSGPNPEDDPYRELRKELH